MSELQERLAHIPDRPLVAPPKVKPRTRIEKAPKYRNKRVEVDGIKFDSAKEAHRWTALKLMEASGQIRDLRRQVAFELAPAVRLDGEKRMKPAIRYWADFTFVERGVLVVVDCKSAPTRKLAAYRMKKHMLAVIHKLQIREV